MIGIQSNIVEIVVLAAGANALLRVRRAAGRVRAFGWPRKIGTNWFMPAFVNSRFGVSGISEDDGTMVCCFDLKKSRNDWRICVLVIMANKIERGSFCQSKLGRLQGELEVSGGGLP